MIPVLYLPNAADFSSFGLGVLTDTISCEVTEERNGIFECLLKYPVSGQHYGLITKECIIKAKPNDTAADQAFRIYRITKPLNGIVTIYGQHISYDLANVPVMPFSTESRSPQLILSQLLAGDTRFTGWTDYSDAKAFSVTQPKSVRACLGGTEGSMLSKWYGEFEWDNFTVKFHSHRGQKTGVVIEYGKNLTALEQDEDNSGVYTALLPYAVYTPEGLDTETMVTLPEVTLPIVTSEIVRKKTLIMDFTEQFGSDTVITEEALRTKAKSYIKANPLGATIPTVKVSFEPLWKQPEYSALLERVNLCDTVTIRHSLLGVSVSAMVIETVYDTLAERYVSISLGQSKSSMITTISEVQSSVDKVESTVGRFPKLLQSAIGKATGLITGQSGGYVVIHTAEENGQPYELLILDAPSIDEAVNVWRWNVGGLGFSHNGYNGLYETAITADGQIVADFITSGSLVANIIKAGVIQSQDGSSWWDLESGEVVLRAYVSTDEFAEKSAYFQQNVDGLNSYVATLTETMESVSNEHDILEERLQSSESRLSQLQHTVNGLSVTMQEQYIGGINYVQNSSGLNGITDDWSYSGTVKTDASTDTQNNTVSNSCFVLGATSSLSQYIQGVVPGAYTISVRAKKTSSMSAYFYVTYNGNKTKYLFNKSTAFDWTDFSVTLTDVTDPTLRIYCYCRDASVYLADIMITEGAIPRKWTPAPNEIYTQEVKIDKRGIEVSNKASSQRTVITNTEFAGYYNDEVIFTLNKDETQTRKTTVDGELTVGKTKFVPMPTASDGLNIVILD
jgi:phage minor structural protein|nr:MAG TPA: tail protein [Caudoviricetes sp.]